MNERTPRTQYPQASDQLRKWLSALDGYRRSHQKAGTWNEQARANYLRMQTQILHRCS